jgi:hypothetical protein
MRIWFWTQLLTSMRIQIGIQGPNQCGSIRIRILARLRLVQYKSAFGKHLTVYQKVMTE